MVRLTFHCQASWVRLRAGAVSGMPTLLALAAEVMRSTVRPSSPTSSSWFGLTFGRVMTRNGAATLLPAGRGDLDLAGLLKRLAQSGYGGQVVSEYEGEAEFGASTAESVAYLRGVAAGVTA